MKNQASNRPKVLAVDDEDFNLDILSHYLDEAGFEPVTAENGEIGLAKLYANPDIELVVLDRMMPKLNGMEFIQKVKEDKRFCDLPIIMQTAAASKEQVMEGIKAGVFYYLTKPYEGAMLISIVRAALSDSRNRKEMQDEVRRSKHVLGLMEKASFHFRTLDEAKNLSFFIANCFPEPETAIYGISEILINAVEHGNLGITYSEKTKLIMNGEWEKEIQKRLASAEYGAKRATLIYEADEEGISITVKDQGKGFDWKKYIEVSPERMTDPHGRGIVTAKMMSFSSVEYKGTGSEVICRHLFSAK